MTGRKVRILCPGGHGIGALTWSGHGWELTLAGPLRKPHPIWPRPRDGEPTYTDLRQIPPLDLARLTADEPPAAGLPYVGLRHTWPLDHLPDLFETGCPRCQLNLLLDVAGLRRHVAAHRRPYRLPANTPCCRPPQTPPASVRPLTPCA